MSHSLNIMSGTKHPKQGISEVRNLLSGEVVPFQEDGFWVAVPRLSILTLAPAEFLLFLE